MDLTKAKVIHFIGIGGCGMSAIAKILCEMGKSVQGSDKKESPNTIRLKDLGVKVFIDHKDLNIRGANIVVISSAIPKDNDEVKAAKAERIKIISRAEALSWILDQFSTRICVAGTHGKTTTTSMISTMLSKSGQNPTYLIGAEADTIAGNSRLGGGNYVVAEADESDGSFLKLNPTIAVVTNIEPDHMEHYKTISKLMDAFGDFIKSIPDNGHLIINSDYENSNILLKQSKKTLNCIKIGLEKEADLRAINLKYDKINSTFEVVWKEKCLGEIVISVPGMQNIMNALASIAVGLALGLSFETICNGLRYFKGVKRRFQRIGVHKGIMVVDDYAHHPTEIAATLRAAKSGWKSGKRIICVFQPHRYSRTLYLHKMFENSFDDADVIIITDIYSAGEEPIEGVSADLIVSAASKSKKEVHYIPKKENVSSFLLKNAKDGDMIITAGAGDIHTVGKEFLARLKAKD